MIRLQVLTMATGKGLKGGSSNLLKINTQCQTAPVWDGGESQLCCQCHQAQSPPLTLQQPEETPEGKQGEQIAFWVIGFGNHQPPSMELEPS